ncbi:MAG: YifB family Mg chelatase-like AAA ATPase [Firmicutes bacterium]|nr:YifB family Mg chelatase-like AAA ATPase [Bacillota bacterium]
MLAKVRTVALDGMKGELIEIETDISNGLPYFSIVGMADASVREATERVKRAIINSGLEYPRGKITVNLSPAYIHKKGSHYDLGIAIGLLLSKGTLECNTDKMLFLGELSLDGKILPVKGVLPMVMSVIEDKTKGIERIILPRDNCKEAYLFLKNTNIKIFPADTLMDVVKHLDGNEIIAFSHNFQCDYHDDFLDFGDIKGHENVKEAIMIAVAGNHNLLMIGPSGTGKTMLAKRITGILTPMTLEEQIETTKIYSYAGKLSKDMPIISERPFRYIVPGSSKTALLGGGYYPKPGEVSLAHNGVLFIDEMLEYPQNILDSLRIPVEEKEVNLIRKNNNITFPSKFLLVGATNPCKCGFFGDSKRQCTCTQSEINRYRNKLSGALADRIDIAIEVNSIEYDDIENDVKKEYCSKMMKNVVYEASQRQKSRYKNLKIRHNSDLDANNIEVFCNLDESGKKFMETVYRTQHISMRRYHKILKIARTIADIKGKEEITMGELATAFHYTRFFTEERG